ncbi:glycoside hydrolase [Clostridiales bacterium PH28_bin88]|nr:glycoside hydrolase [Clostridiales bacterium PH28_bin88]
MSQGFLALVLHAHLPYVRHPETEHALAERWLYEAITETYLPLVKVLDRLIEDGVGFHFTVSLSPPLLCMLSDPLIQKRYLRHLEKLQELAEKEVTRTAREPHFQYLARVYQDLFNGAYDIFHHKYGDNLLNAFKRYLDLGNVEVITSAATHGFLPLIGIHPQVIRAQVGVAVDVFSRHFGRRPRGLWLPECGYAPGVDRVLGDYGIEYFFVDTHGLLFASPRPRYGVYAPIRCPESGVAAFGRDVESSLQVWSAQEGYPGDCDYREFYRDIGFDLDWEYIKDYVHPDGYRIDTGLKYYRITGKTNHKEPYMPQWARDKAAIHAGNFMFNREKQIEYLAAHMDRPPIIVAPYDAELFGHWWFEGPQWLDFLFRKIAYNQNVFSTITPGQYLDRFPHNQPSTPCMSSWGNKGYNDVWLEGSNDWIYRHLHQAAKRIQHLVRQNLDASGLKQRALNQSAREVLLAESSDWAFIMKTGTMVDYACRRTVNHVGRFLKLHDDITNDRLEAAYLEDIEEKDNIFPHIDYRAYV